MSLPSADRKQRMRRALPAVAALWMAIAFAACDPPGKGPKAERGYRRSAPVIAALDRYRAEHGQYPDSLRMLVLRFLPDSALRLPEREQERYPLEYHRTPGGYDLSFQYTGPGMSECGWSAETRKWACRGHF
jgi:hypothetical protein